MHVTSKETFVSVVPDLSTQRTWLRSALAATAVTLIATGCGATAKDSGWSEEAISKASGSVAVMVVNSQIGVGENRLAFGLITSNGELLQNAEGSVQLFRLAGNETTPAGEHRLRAVSLRENTNHLHDDGTNHLHDDPIMTMYVTNVELSEQDWWGAEIHVQAGGKRYEKLRARFFVQQQTTVPPMGVHAPKSTQRTMRDVKDAAEIDSSRPPRPELHQMTVAEAAVSGKPSVVAFATPAFCQTRFCGPVIDSVVAPLAKQYEGRANFLHIEPYSMAEARKGRLVPVPEMEQWGLTSEPYLFVLDREGRIAGKLEGIVEQGEVTAILDRLLEPNGK